MHTMPALLAVLAVAGFILFILWQQKRERYPALPAPISTYEREIIGDEFADMVLKTSNEVPVVVDFYARWCGPCHDFAPVMAEMARDYNGSFLLARVDFDQNPQLVKHFKVTCIPTIALFRNGEKLDGFEGGQQPHQVRYFLAKHGINAKTA